MKLKIARIVPDFRASDKAHGYFVSFLKLSTYQRERGHEIVIITRGRRNQEEEIEGFRVIRIASGYPLSFLPFQHRAARIIRRESPDIIHSHGRTGLGLPFLISDFPHLVHMHGLPYLAFRQFRRILSGSTRQLAYDLRIHALYKLGLRRANCVVSYSHDLATMLGTYGIPRGAVKIVYNGVDERFLEDSRDASADIETSLPSRGELILFVGRPLPIKGIFYLLRAMPSILKRHPSAKLIVAGSTRGDSLGSYIHYMKLTDHVITLGHVRHDQLPWLYSACTVSVANTIVPGYPKTLIESLARGTPVVASHNIDNEMIIGNHNCGLLVDPTNPVEIARAVNELLSEPATREEMGVRGRALVQRQFTWRTSVEALDGLYERLVPVQARN